MVDSLCCRNTKVTNYEKWQGIYQYKHNQSTINRQSKNNQSTFNLQHNNNSNNSNNSNNNTNNTPVIKPSPNNVVIPPKPVNPRGKKGGND